MQDALEKGVFEVLTLRHLILKNTSKPDDSYASSGVH